MALDDKAIGHLAMIPHLHDMVEKHANNSLERHQVVVTTLNDHSKRIAALEIKAGTPSAPPPAVIATEAHRIASNANLEAAALEGRVLAYMASAEAKLDRLEIVVAKNTAWTEEIRDFVRGTMKSKTVRAAAVGLIVTALGAIGSMIHGFTTRVASCSAAEPTITSAVVVRDAGGDSEVKR
jgi:hypothetical protein